MEDVEEFLAGLRTQASSRFMNGLSCSGASGLCCNSRGFGIITEEHDDRETPPSGLFHFKQMRKLVKSTSKFENYCFSSKDGDEWFDDLSGVGEIQEEARIRVRETRVDHLYTLNVLEEISPSTMKGGLEGFPDQLEESANDDGSTDMKTVTEDEMFAQGVLEDCSSFPQENVSVNAHEPMGGEDADVSVNLRCHGEEFRAADPLKGQGGFSCHSEKNADKDSRHDICLNPELEEVCVMDTPKVPFEILRELNQDSKVTLDESVIIRSRELNQDSKVILDESVIIINDEDSDNEEYSSISARFYSSVELNSISIDSDGEASSPSILRSDSWNSVDSSYSDDDCLVVEQPISGKGKQQRPKNHNHAYTANADNVRRHVVDDSSDCEIMVGSQDEIRMHWEDAAMRKRFCKPMQSKGSRVGRADSGLPCSSSLRKGDKLVGRDPDTSLHHQESELERPATSQELAESVATSDSSTFSSKREVSSCGDKVLQPESVVDTSEDWLELDKITQRRMSHVAACRSSESGYIGTQAGKLADQSMPGHEKIDKGGINHFAQSCDSQYQNQLDSNGTKASDDRDGEAGVALESQHFAGDREKLKETVEFKKADEEEWARRQLVLERQALEAQRMRKRKRADAGRKLEMENRQKQRLLEIRETQQMEKNILGLKEHFRGEVRAELDHKSLGCIDMASLLRRLGVFVDGGAFPTPEQVNAAYKRAILRFHPDRAAALIHDDPRHQVEAEETFKLISRMKSLLPHVASQHFNLPRNGFR